MAEESKNNQALHDANSVLLEQSPDVQYALYADEVTIWVRKEPDGTIQSALLDAVNVVQGYALAGGLPWQAEKSGLPLVFKSRKRTNIPPNVTVHLNEHLIPRVDGLRMLGVHIQHNGKATYTLQLRCKRIAQVTHMIKRITNHGHGPLEKRYSPIGARPHKQIDLPPPLPHRHSNRDKPGEHPSPHGTEG